MKLTVLLFTLLSILVLPAISYTQNFAPCGMPHLSREEIRAYESQLQPFLNQANRNQDLVAVPLKIHIITEDDGSGGLSLTELNQGIANLNYHFQAANMEFYICGAIDYIYNSTYYRYHSDEESALAAEADEVTDAMNIYIPLTVDFGGPVSGYAYLPSNNAVSTRQFTRKNDFSVNSSSTGGGTLIHEMGHNFNLYHTFEGTESGNTHLNAEHVPRTGTNANCETEGDLLCDTPADPGYDRNDPSDPNDSYNFEDATCNFIQGQADIFGNLYAPSVSNTMSYFPYWCEEGLTAGQHNRMNAALDLRLSHTAYSLDCPPTSVDLPNDVVAIQNEGGIELSWTDNANNESGYLIERSISSSTDGFQPLVAGGVAPDMTTYIDYTTTSQATYWYRIKASNGDANLYSNVATVTTTLVYCTPTQNEGSCPFGTGMDGISISKDATILMSNPNNTCSNELSNFSASHSLTVQNGETYDVDIQLINMGGVTQQRISIWIDFNRNGDFEDEGEQVATDILSIVGNPTVPTFPIHIPSNISGGTTHMRVRSADSGNNEVVVPCGFITFSEAEEYTVVVDAPLSNALSNFNGKIEGQEVHLNWKTLQENNSDYFILERAYEDENTFVPIEKIQAKGYSSSTNFYNYVDRAAKTGANSYRLKQVDLSGAFEYSNIIVVQMAKDRNELSVMPNPATEQITIRFFKTNENPESLIKIFNTRGQLQSTQVVATTKGVNSMELDVSDWLSGVYVVKLDRNLVKFIKQ